MPQIRITADVRQVERLGDDYGNAAEVGMRRLVERGEQLVREEAPKVTRNLIQGVSSDVKVGRGSLRGEIIITARTGRVGRRDGVLHRPGGTTKKVSLRAVPAFNYPEAVAKGTGIYGPEHSLIRPRKARALLVPVRSVPTLNGKPVSYIEADGRLYVMRRSMKGTKPNPYDERAARRLESEAQAIYDRAIRDKVGGQP
jgi:hypothetical protein